MLFHESFENNGELIHSSGVKVCHYLYPFTVPVRAIPQLPQKHCFFHRPLNEIFNDVFEQGFILDGFEEAALTEAGSLQEHAGWHLITDVPVVAAFRFRLKNEQNL